MKCEMARDNVVLAYYGELPDELAGALEQHLMTCEECREEVDLLQAMEGELAKVPGAAAVYGPATIMNQIAGRAQSLLAELTGREHEVFRLLGEGLGNAELGARLHLSEATVKTHVSRILAKLDLRSRTQAAVLAARL